VILIKEENPLIEKILVESYDLDQHRTRDSMLSLITTQTFNVAYRSLLIITYVIIIIILSD